MAGITLAIIGFFLFMWNRLSTGQLAVLFTDLDSRDSNQIVANLQSANVHHKVSKDGSRIMVPATRLTNSALVWHSKEYRLQDQSVMSFLTVISQLVPQVLCKISIEFVLLRANFPEPLPVSSQCEVRAFILCFRRELFSRQQVEPSASVILRMRGAVRPRSRSDPGSTTPRSKCCSIA